MSHSFNVFPGGSWRRIHQQRGRQGLDLLEKIPWRREHLPTQVFSPGEFHGQKSLAGYSPWGLKELDTAEQLTLSVCHFVSCKGKFSLSFPDVPFSFKHMVFFFFFRIHSTDEHIFFFLIYLTLLIVNWNVIKELLFLSGCVCLEKKKKIPSTASSSVWRCLEVFPRQILTMAQHIPAPQASGSRCPWQSSTLSLQLMDCWIS